MFTILGFLRLVQDYMASGMDVEQEDAHVDTTPSYADWVPPATGCLKLNIDAASFSDGLVGLGGVLRDEFGKIQGMMVKRITGHGNMVAVPGAQAMAFGIRMAKIIRSHAA